MKTATNKMLLAIATALILLVGPIPFLRADSAATYKAKCAMCHGADGKGETPTGKALKLKDLGSEDVQKTSDEDLGEVISKGKGKMPAAKGLTPDQVKDLVAFVRSLKKK